MACIDKVLIRGIRSFSPLEKDKVIINFNTPLTLIVGQNGAGKTTIIECLKYITTGDLPPNSKGGAFVIDPKIVGEREVKGVVKLKFRDVSGKEVICHRVLQSVQKPKKIEQRTIDVSMEKKVDGEKRKITSRCGEIDNEMITHLGVSKAILNNVIFCHQEDSNWPLSEGKALKQKFDDIFASTRYSKALDAIKKFKQEQEGQCREYNAELKHLKEEKKKADDLQGRLKDAQSKMDAYQAEVNRLKNELKPVEKRLAELDKLYDEFTRKERNIAEFESTRRQLERQQQDLLGKVSNPFNGSRDELQHLADEHYQQLEKEAAAMQECELQLIELHEEEEELKTKLNQLASEYGRLELRHKQHKDTVRHRDTQIRELADKLTLSQYTATKQFTASNVQSFIKEVDKKRQAMEKKAQKEKEEYLATEKQLSDELMELRDTQSRVQQKLEMMKKEHSDKQQQLVDISRQLKKIGSSGAVIDQIELELKKDEEELAEYRSTVSIPALERELQNLRSQKKQLDERMQALQHEMSIVTQQSSARGALDVLVREKRNKEQMYQNELGHLEAELLTLLGYMPSDEELAKSITDLEVKKKDELKHVVASVKRDSSDLSTVEAQLEEYRKQLNKKRAHLEALEQQVLDVCGTSEYKEKLKEVEEELSSTQENLNTIKGSQAYFKTCIDKVRATHKCPLCARGYDSKKGEDDLIRSISIRLNDKIPRLLPTFEEKLANLRQQQQQLMELKPKTEDLCVMKAEEVPQLEKVVKEKTVAVDKLRAILKKAEQEQTALQSQLDEIRNLQPHAVKLSQLQQDLKELDRRVNTETSKLGGETVRSATVVNRELKKIQTDSEEVGRKMDIKRQEISSSQQTIRDLEDRIVIREKERLELQKQVQMRQTLVSKKEELNTASESLNGEIKSASRQLKPVGDKLVKLEQERARVQEEREDREDVNHAEIAELIGLVDSIKSNTSTIKRYEESGASSSLQQCEDKMKDLRQTATENLTVKKSLEEKKDKTMRQQANAQVRQRELQDNLDLMDKQFELDDIRRKLVGLKDELRKSGLDQYEGEYQRLQAESQKLLKEKGSAEGQRHGHEMVKAQIQRELQSDLFRNVDQSHREMVIMLKTTQMANGDLDKYYKALDRAIMKFHFMKMQEINKIIKELWMKTYKGGDIDTIEIRSDDELEEVGTVRTRRIYHYRVVMVKGGMALDMRGRCSAGQKVLASIIIRLALAETFCLNCGLLALDEPTTNLDSENIAGLAEALADILRERSRQKNFQLIIITHDVQFVDLIGRSEFVDDYYLVQKPVGEAASTVRKCPITELPHYS